MASIGPVISMFANGLWDPGSITPKTQKIVLVASLLNTQSSKIRVKYRNQKKGVLPFFTPWCSSYWKGSLQITLDYGRQLFIWLIDGTVTSSNTPSHSWSGSNCSKRLTPHFQDIQNRSLFIRYSLISGPVHLPFWSGLIPLKRTQHTLSSADRPNNVQGVIQLYVIMIFVMVHIYNDYSVSSHHLLWHWSLSRSTFYLIYVKI